MSPILRRRLCFAAILMLGLLHGLLQARIRPLYQVSDEFNYIFTAQYNALPLVSGPARVCVSPPDGSALVGVLPGGGKPGFQLATTHVLTAACRGGGTFPLFTLRALNALSLPVLAACAWVLARTLWPTRMDVAPLAGILVAAHPVIAKYGSGVTPDAWANALAGIGLVAGARLLMRRGSWLDVAALLGSTILALAWKETGSFLVVHLALVLGFAILSTLRNHPSPWRIAVLAVAASVAAVATLSRLAWLLSSTYGVGAPAVQALAAPLAFVDAVMRDLLPRLPGMLGTTWTVLGNFGGSVIVPLPTSTAVAVATLVAAAVGWGFIVAAPRRGLDVPPRVLGIVWLVVGLTCLLQPSVRQVLLQSQDIHQGRWLFPLAAPAAALLAAGLAGLRPTGRWLALPAALWIAVPWLTLAQLGQWYYVTVPDVPRRAHVFLRGVGGGDVGEERVWSVLTDVARSQSGGVGYLLALACLASSLGAFHSMTLLTSRRDNDRHT